MWIMFVVLDANSELRRGSKADTKETSGIFDVLDVNCETICNKQFVSPTFKLGTFGRNDKFARWQAKLWEL